MNIFRLSDCPKKAAQLQCNEHVIKMTLESAQMLSSAHRILDGSEIIVLKNGRKNRQWVHPDKHLDNVLYKGTHVNHPSSVWVRASKVNYMWLYHHFEALAKEFTFRYGKTHLSYEKLNHILCNSPKNIPNIPETQFYLAMQNRPQCIVNGDPVASYRLFYKTKMQDFKMNWTKRPVPEFMR